MRPLSHYLFRTRAFVIYNGYENYNAASGLRAIARGFYHCCVMLRSQHAK